MLIIKKGIQAKCANDKVKDHAIKQRSPEEYLKTSQSKTGHGNDKEVAFDPLFACSKTSFFRDDGRPISHLE